MLRARLNLKAKTKDIAVRRSNVDLHAVESGQRLASSGLVPQPPAELRQCIIRRFLRAVVVNGLFEGGQGLPQFSLSGRRLPQAILGLHFVKKQQMTWTERSAPLLLQIRTQTLNGDLRAKLWGWYPRMKESDEIIRKGA